MKTLSLKNKILEANSRYRAGTPIMEDQEYDDLVEEYKALVSDSEYNEFRDSLNEGSIENGKKISHPEVMGSLDKLTVEKPDQIREYISKYIKNRLSISAKVDGISCRLNYNKGKLVSASTRGDGHVGQKIDHIIKYVKNVPWEIPCLENVNIRGELVIFKDDFSKMYGYANPRNATAGIVNRIETSKEWNTEEIKNITFVAYTVLGDEFSKREQFEFLERNGFYTTWKMYLPENTYSSVMIVDILSDYAAMEHPYETDGLVISDEDYHNEKEYRPKSQKAVKLNQLVATTKLIDVDWSEVSKDGKITCVGIIEPTKLGGSTISRVTLNNLDYIEKLNLKIGSVVSLVKRGDIIPAITGVISNENATIIRYPHVCPCCGSALVREGPFLYCKNENCIDKTTTQMELFVKNLDIENVSFKTLKNFGISGFKTLLDFKADTSYKSETKFMEELKNKMFNKSDKELFYAMPMKDFAKKTLKTIVEYYGWDKIKSEEIESETFSSLPEGIGDITMNKFLEGYKTLLKNVKLITEDSRYSYEESANIIAETVKNCNGMSICFTGALSIKRNEAKRMAEEKGFEVKDAVSKGLTYLVQADKNSTSTKTKKAIANGTKIIDENDFIEMMK